MTTTTAPKFTPGTRVLTKSRRYAVEDHPLYEDAINAALREMRIVNDEAATRGEMDGAAVDAARAKGALCDTLGEEYAWVSGVVHRAAERIYLRSVQS